MHYGVDSCWAGDCGWWACCCWWLSLSTGCIEVSRLAAGHRLCWCCGLVGQADSAYRKAVLTRLILHSSVVHAVTKLAVL